MLFRCLNSFWVYRLGVFYEYLTINIEDGICLGLFLESFEFHMTFILQSETFFFFVSWISRLLYWDFNQRGMSRSFNELLNNIDSYYDSRQNRQTTLLSIRIFESPHQSWLGDLSIQFLFSLGLNGFSFVFYSNNNNKKFLFQWSYDIFRYLPH